MREEERVRRLRATFAAELASGLRGMSRNLVALRETPSEIVQGDLVAALMRTAHSLKGAADSARAPAIRRACHLVEDVLAEVRAKGALDPRRDARIDLLLATVAALESAGGRLVAEGEEEVPELAALLPRLERAAQGESLGAGLVDASRTETRPVPGVAPAEPAPPERGGFEALCEELARIAARVADDAGKSVDLEIAGAPWRVPDELAAQLRDPLRHLVRNSVDHGVESPADRRAAGKPERGRVVVTATPGRDGVEVSVSDDGGGLDLAALAEAARRGGLRVPSSSTALAELVFVPGLTTRPSAGESSGRGVGLDAVRARVASLGGAVEVDSERGRGTVFTLRLPVERPRVAVTLVTDGEATYALPTERVAGTLQVRRSDLRWTLGMPWVLVEGRLAPLASLTELIRGGDVSAAKAAGGRARRLAGRAVILEHAHGVVLLGIDRVTDPWRLAASWRRLLRRGGLRDYVAFLRRRLRSGGRELEIDQEIRPLGPRLDLRFFTGAARLPHGGVIWLLDPEEIVRSVLRSTPRPEQGERLP